MSSSLHPNIINLLEIVNRLPLKTEDQKIEFMKNYVKILKTYEEETKKNKYYFSEQVLPLITSGGY